MLVQKRERKRDKIERVQREKQREVSEKQGQSMIMRKECENVIKNKQKKTE